ncbi:MAG: class I SAM-dependent methyltransferase [Gemmatimonadota bacterium]|nr:class I SAM-dependent methyltransferase [Gemmatimonadota bacterium]
MTSSLHKRVVRKWKTYAPERWWGDYLDIRFFLTEKLCGLSGRMVLDAGCNAGIMASETAAAGDNVVVGLDLRYEALVEYRRLFDDLGLVPRTVAGSWEAPMFRDESFDAIILSWVLCDDETDKKKGETIEKLRALLKPGGSIYFVEANRLCPIQGCGLDRYWTIERAREFFTSHGFRIEEELGWNPLPSLVFWLPPRLKMRLGSRLLTWLYPPGKLVQYIPGWYELFRASGKYRALRRYCRTYYLHATKV